MNALHKTLLMIKAVVIELAYYGQLFYYKSTGLRQPQCYSSSPRFIAVMWWRRTNKFNTHFFPLWSCNLRPHFEWLLCRNVSLVDESVRLIWSKVQVGKTRQGVSPRAASKRKRKRSCVRIPAMLQTSWEPRKLNWPCALSRGDGILSLPVNQSNSSLSLESVSSCM